MAESRKRVARMPPHHQRLNIYPAQQIFEHKTNHSNVQSECLPNLRALRPRSYRASPAQEKVLVQAE